jgi:signal transduction histidine kinase
VSWALLVVVAWLGWALLVAGALVMRRRMALVADAEHELRGAATALALLADDRLARLQVDRMSAALADLARARGAAPPPAAQVAAGRLAQVLANVSANAAEHGVGPAQVSSEPVGEVVRLEVSNRAATPRRRRARGRGRGLRIAKRAARELGGRVSLERADGELRAMIELPVPEQGPRRAEPDLVGPGAPAEGRRDDSQDPPRAA